MRYAIDHTSLHLDFERLFLQLPYPIAMKNHLGEYRFCNQAASNLAGFSHPEELIGLKDADFKTKVSELHEQFTKQDHLVLNGFTQTNLDVATYQNNTLKCYITHKHKYIDKSNNPFVFFSMTELPLPKVLRLLSTLKRPRFSKHTISGSYELTQGLLQDEDQSPIQLSPRQLECLFFLIRGKSLKEIAHSLKLSMSTVEEHIQKVKTKLNCYSKSQLIDKAFSLGYAYMLPYTIYQEL